MNNNKLRYAVIGGGMMGQEHIRNISLLENATVSAVVDTNDEMLKESVALAASLNGDPVQSFHHHGELITANAADALVVVTPNFTHVEILRDLLATELPVMVEKPLATTREDARELVELTGKREAPVWVAMEYRYMPPIARLIDEVRQGNLGNLRMLSIREHRFPFLEKIGDWNRFNHLTGGTLVEKCCHFFDLMRHIVGAEPVKVFASGSQSVNHLDESYDGETPDIIDNAMVIVEFSNGVRASLDLCMFAEGSYFQEQVTAIGDVAKMEARVPGPSRFWPGHEERHAEVVISPRASKDPHHETITVDENILKAGDHHGSVFFQHQKFQQLINEGGQPEVGIADGAIAVEIGLAAEQSIRTGKAVDF